jgi:hypothetical protein
MAKTDWVYEIINPDEPNWQGNELYKEFAYAKFCGRQDYQEDFAAKGRLDWDFLCKGLYFLVEDDIPTGVELRVRHINSLLEEV